MKSFLAVIIGLALVLLSSCRERVGSAIFGSWVISEQFAEGGLVIPRVIQVARIDGDPNYLRFTGLETEPVGLRRSDGRMAAAPFEETGVWLFSRNRAMFFEEACRELKMSLYVAEPDGDVGDLISVYKKQ